MSKKRIDPTPKKDIIKFIGDKAQVDDYGAGYIWGVKDDKLEMIADVRGWGSIQNLFRNESKFDYHGAEQFQYDLGKFIAEAITEKINREKDE